MHGGKSLRVKIILQYAFHYPNRAFIRTLGVRQPVVESEWNIDWYNTDDQPSLPGDEISVIVSVFHWTNELSVIELHATRLLKTDPFFLA